MPDPFPRLDGLMLTTRFAYAVRHCPKCGWAGPVGDATLRYCGPGQRVEGDWGEMFLFGEPGPPPCDGGAAGEHFHWQCAVCRYRRVLPVPTGETGTVN